MPIHMQSKTDGEKTFKDVAAYAKEYPGWVPAEKDPGTELTIDLVKGEGTEGLKMSLPGLDEGHVLHFVKDGGRRKKTRKTRRKGRRSTRKSRR